MLPLSAAQLLLHCCSVQAELGDLIEDSEALLGMWRAVQAEQMVHYFWYPARHSRDISRGFKKKNHVTNDPTVCPLNFLEFVFLVLPFQRKPESSVK